MRFYGYKWEEMLSLPLRLFWTMVKNKNRITAAENLRQIQLLGFQNLEEASRKEYIQAQQDTLGQIALSDERDEEGVKQLKALAGG
jgi:hypothetical protein